MFTAQEVMRYSKHLTLEGFGPELQQKLKRAKVLIIGAGGLGCPVMLYLNAAGIGHLGIADFDIINISNLHRQVLYSHGDIGKKKVNIAVEKLQALNPFTTFEILDIEINAGNVASVINNYDLVIDGCDNFKTRYIVNDGCVAAGKTLIYGSILGYEGQVGLFNYRGSNHLRDIFPEPPDKEDVPDCSENGVLSTVTGIIGTIMAQEAVNALTEMPSLVNKFLLFNARTFEKTILNYEMTT